jgi:hypothetical protein
VADDRDRLIETLKRVAVLLKEAEIPFALAGSFAMYARGAQPRDHDVDFVLKEADVAEAVQVLADGGLRPQDASTEDWLAKVYDEDRLVDLIFAANGRPVDDDLLARADELDVRSVWMPVMSATDLLVSRLLAMTEHYCDFAAPLAMARPVREQIDWPMVRRAVADSPYALSFLHLAGLLDVAPAVSSKESQP